MSGHAVLVTGGRAYANRAALYATLDRLHAENPITLLIHGACMVDRKPAGADWLGDDWAEERGVAVEPFPVLAEEWAKFHRGAPPVRNSRMVTYLLATVGDKTCVRAPGGNGTADCTGKAMMAGVRVVWVEEEQ